MSSPNQETSAAGPSFNRRMPPRRVLRVVARTAWIATLLLGVVGGYGSGLMHLRGHSCGAHRQAMERPPCHGAHWNAENPNP
jgi:hypothetical protein